MDAAGLGGRFTHRQRDVDRLGVEARVERLILQRVAARRERRGDAILEAVDERPLPLALIRRHPAERLEGRRYGSALAERRHAQGLEGGLVGGAGYIGEDLLLEVCDFGHGTVPVHPSCPASCRASTSSFSVSKAWMTGT